MQLSQLSKFIFSCLFCVLFFISAGQSLERSLLRAGLFFYSSGGPSVVLPPNFGGSKRSPNLSAGMARSSLVASGGSVQGGEFIKSIVDHLQKKYDPLSLIQHGSRLRGDFDNASDYDFFLILQNPQVVLAETFESAELDLRGVHPGDRILSASYALKEQTPIWPLKLLVDSPEGYGEQLISRTKAAYDRGPQPLTIQETFKYRHLLIRFLERIKKRELGPISQSVYEGNFKELAIQLWFLTRSRWTISLVPALKTIEREDPQFLKLLDTMDGEALLGSLFESQRGLSKIISHD